MMIKRTIPPAAAPLGLKSLISGLRGLFMPQTYLKKRERELKQYFGVRHVYLVSSGTAALVLILQALKTIAPGRRKVLIPAYTCFSVPAAVVKAGLEVALCDIDEETFDFDQEQLPREIGPDTLCVVPNHLFGIPADVEAVRALRHDNDFFVIEDAAQAMGGASNGKKLGTIGDAGFFSLGRGKNITAGSGGIIVTNNDTVAAAIAERYQQLARPGVVESIIGFLKAALLAVFIHPSFYWFPAGLPFLRLGETRFEPNVTVKKLSGMKAGLMQNWQERLETSNRTRRENGAALCIMHGKRAIRGCSALLRFPFLAENKQTRDALYGCLQKRGLGASGMYPASINQISELRGRFRSLSYPSAERIASRLLTLPTHELLSPEDKHNIISTVCLLAPRTLSADPRPAAPGDVALTGEHGP